MTSTVESPARTRRNPAVSAVIGAAPVLAWIVLGLLLTVAVLPQISDYVPALQALSLTLAVLLGAAVEFFVEQEVDGGGVVASGLPLLIPVLTALVLGIATRLRRPADISSAATVASATLVTWMVVMIVVALLPAPFDARFATGSVEAGVRPHIPVLGAIVLWAMIWGSRWSPVRGALLLLTSLSVALTLVAAIVIAQTLDDPLQIAGGTAAVLLSSVNLVILLLLWPLGHPIESGGFPVTFLDAAGDAPLLWAVPVLAVLLLTVWCTSWRVPATVQEYGRRVAITFGIVFALLLVLPIVSAVSVEPTGGAIEHLSRFEFPLGLSPELSTDPHVGRAVLVGLLITLACAATWLGFAFRDGMAWAREIPTLPSRVTTPRSAAKSPSPAPPPTCPNCGAAAVGRFCGSCGTPLRP